MSDMPDEHRLESVILEPVDYRWAADAKCVCGFSFSGSITDSWNNTIRHALELCEQHIAEIAGEDSCLTHRQ